MRSPRKIEEYCNFYNITCEGNKGKFYKAVHKIDTGECVKYVSNHDRTFSYEIGKIARSEYLENDPYEECGSGIHITGLFRSLQFGFLWDDLAILEVEADLDKIVVPYTESRKVRCQEVSVLREVPLAECGVMGLILANKQKRYEKPPKKFRRFFISERKHIASWPLYM